MGMRGAETKAAEQRLGILLLAEALGSVAEACRRRGISRTQFYEYRRRFLAYGLDGLKDLPPVHKSHPQTTSPEIAERVLAFALEYPAWGCGRISDLLKLSGMSVSGPTIQKILLANNLGSRHDRLLRLEEKALEDQCELTGEQLKAIEQANPCFKERCRESSRPGELLGQDTIYVGRFAGVGKLYLQAVVDTYDSYAFTYLHAGKLPGHTAFVLQQDVMPHYEERGLTVSALLTDNCREYCGKDLHPFESYLSLNDIEHLTTKLGDPQTNGFVERFRRTVLDEFLRPALRQREYGSIEALRKDLDAWLKQYNEARPHRGYRNMGKCPAEMLRDYLASSAKNG